MKLSTRKEIISVISQGRTTRI